MEYAVITPSVATDVLSLADARRELDLTETDDDILLVGLLASAVRHVEKHSGRFLGPTLVDYYFDRFDLILRLPHSPIASVVIAEYLSSASASSYTLLDPSSYRLIGSESPMLLPALGSRWPYAPCGTGVLRVRATVGYSGDTVPEGLIQAVRTALGLFYDKPTNVPGAHKALWDTVNALIQPYRFVSV